MRCHNCGGERNQTVETTGIMICGTCGTELSGPSEELEWDDSKVGGRLVGTSRVKAAQFTSFRQERRGTWGIYHALQKLLFLFLKILVTEVGCSRDIFLVASHIWKRYLRSVGLGIALLEIGRA